MALPKRKSLTVENRYVGGGEALGNTAPMRVTALVRAATGKTPPSGKVRITSLGQVAEDAGVDSMAYYVASELIPAEGGGLGNIPLSFIYQADGTTASTGDITPLADQTKDRAYKIICSEFETVEFEYKVGQTPADCIAAAIAAVDATPGFPMSATDGTTKINFTAKWRGLETDELKLSVVASGDGAASMTITQPSGGAGVPDLSSDLLEIGEDWETLILNPYGEQGSEAVLDNLYDFNTARWDKSVYKPFVAFYGSTETDVATATTVPATRTLDYTNVKFAVPGSPTLSFLIAARGLLEVAKVANAGPGRSPARDYERKALTSVTPGPVSDQWTSPAERDLAFESGVSHVPVRNGVPTLSDVITFHNPLGEFPYYKYVVDVVRAMNLIWLNVSTFDQGEWSGVPLLSDTDAQVVPEAKKPSDFVNAAAAIQRTAASTGVLTRVAETIPRIRAEISGNQVTLTSPVIFSGNINNKDIINEFTFNFGGA